MSESDDDDLRPEYDLDAIGPGEIGRFHRRNRERSNVVVLDPDVAAVYPNAEAVNEALRDLMSSRRDREKR